MAAVPAVHGYGACAARGGAGARRGRAGAGAQHLDRAIALYETERRPFLRARPELAYGERLRRDGLRTEEARAHLRSAVSTFEALEASPWAERATAELRATGELVRRPTGAPTAQLTPQELQVALAVARGATNKEAAAQLYLSPEDDREAPRVGVREVAAALARRARPARGVGLA